MAIVGSHAVAACINFRLPRKWEFAPDTWASWHVMAGTGLQELMELGGWKSYEMVLRYAHLAPEHLSTAASRIERDLEIVTSEATISLRSKKQKAHRSR